MSLTSASLVSLHHARVGIDFYFRRGAHQLPEGSLAPERVIRDEGIALLADADDLAARRTEV